MKKPLNYIKSTKKALNLQKNDPKNTKIEHMLAKTHLKTLNLQIIRFQLVQSYQININLEKLLKKKV